MSTDGNGSLTNLINFKDYKSKRVSSWDQSGRNADRLEIPANSTATIAEFEGPGIISHIWITIACEDKDYLRKLILRAYWDGEDEPSIETPVGDFFGVEHSWVTSYQCAPFNMSAHETKHGGNAAMNCWFAMPFQKSARFEVVNDCDVPVGAFYYYIDYQQHRSLGEAAILPCQVEAGQPLRRLDGQGIGLGQC